VRYRALLLALLCSWPVGHALAQPPTPARGEDAEGKTIGITRATEAPVIDGTLSEALWATATLIDDLHQINPIEYSTPSQRTEIRITYDDDALYVAAKLWYNDANAITARVLRQGEGLSNEDRLVVMLDPYLDRRSGYRFEVNAHGVRWDALYQNTTSVESNWEGIWQAASQRDADGWTTEMAIPFKTLSFNPNNDSSTRASPALRRASTISSRAWDSTSCRQ
jgi:cellulose/xylan binding protein with CBM9 domain